MTKLSYLIILRSWYFKLSLRERRLILGLTVCFFIVFIWLLLDWFITTRSNLYQSVTKSKITLSDTLILADRLRGLEDRLTELTTLYLNSTLSYEEVTSALDKIIKEKVGTATYSLTRSSNDLSGEENFLGDSFKLEKFTVKIAEISLEKATSLIVGLENGPPKMFIQRADLTKSRSGESLSLTLELASIEEIKN
ncbi:MAG TPA: hypothetical protein PKA63_04630 [Oligoflexia bacterium]|nr:hypothetical protein [Oligoflexia bacterium]HMP47936.1 hypothetical protein [Oligoflexia bacterium]